jgi:hypothetical protein
MLIDKKYINYNFEYEIFDAVYNFASMNTGTYIGWMSNGYGGWCACPKDLKWLKITGTII